MSINLSKQKREGLLDKIEQIRAFLKKSIYDENARQLAGYLNELTSEINGQKYGLVFEEHKEAIDEMLENNLPVLTEEKEFFVDNGGEINFLLEGDNLASLQLLEKTHKGNIDVIYIDPPYNTGNKDFIYDDDFVDSADSFRHSKWLSFMEKRLRIARELLSEKSFIFISIDDNEQTDLKLLCDEILGSENFVASLPTIMNLKGNQDEYGFAGTHEYTIVYVKNKRIGKLGQFPVDEKELETWEQDDKGFFKQGATLKRTGQDAPRENRPYGYFPILVDKQSNTINVYGGYLSSAETRSAPEKLFERFCETSAAVDWWYKNGDKGDEYFSIVYVDNSNRQKLFYPDYIVCVHGETWIIETKGGFDRTGASEDIDIFSPKKCEVLQKYLNKHNLHGGFVRYDKSSMELLICTGEYNDDVSSDAWKLLSEVM